MATTIHTTINIDATPQQVWKILTDLPNYPQWNPFIQSIQGDLVVGNQLSVKINTMTFAPKILVYAPLQELRWLGSLWFKGIFDGEHYFKLSPNDQGGTFFEQGEYFKGLLVPLVKKSIIPDTTQGFEAMNKALKKEAEK